MRLHKNQKKGGSTWIRGASSLAGSSAESVWTKSIALLVAFLVKGRCWGIREQQLNLQSEWYLTQAVVHLTPFLFRSGGKEHWLDEGSYVPLWLLQGDLPSGISPLAAFELLNWPMAKPRPQTRWTNHSAYCISHTLGHSPLGHQYNYIAVDPFSSILWGFSEILTFKNGQTVCMGHMWLRHTISREAGWRGVFFTLSKATSRSREVSALDQVVRQTTASI